MGGEAHPRAERSTGAGNRVSGRNVAVPIEGRNRHEGLPRPEALPEERAREWEEDFPPRRGRVFMVRQSITHTTSLNKPIGQPY